LKKKMRPLMVPHSLPADFVFFVGLSFSARVKRIKDQ